MVCRDMVVTDLGVYHRDCIYRHSPLKTPGWAVFMGDINCLASLSPPTENVLSKILECPEI